MSRQEENSVLNRSDFLRLAALGAGGLGLTALAGCGSKTVVTEGGPPRVRGRGYPRPTRCHHG